MVDDPLLEPHIKVRDISTVMDETFSYMNNDEIVELNENDELFKEFDSYIESNRQFVKDYAKYVSSVNLPYD